MPSSSMATAPSRQELAPDWWQPAAPRRRRREPAQTTFLQTAHSIPPDGQAHIAPILGMHQRNTRPSQALLVWGRRRVGIFVQLAHRWARPRRNDDGALEAPMPAQGRTAQHSTAQDEREARVTASSIGPRGCRHSPANPHLLGETAGYLASSPAQSRRETLQGLGRRASP